MFNGLVKLCLVMAILVLGTANAADPTRPYVAESNVKKAKKKNVPLTLSQTMISPKDSSAVINDQLVKEGGRVSGCLVKRIQNSHVALVCSGKQRNIYLYQ